MSETKPLQFWPGLLAGLGIAQMYNYAIMAWHLPRLKEFALELGITLSPLALCFSKPAAYLGIPLLQLAVLASLVIGLRRKPRWQLFCLVMVNIIGWIILALMARSAFWPLLETMQHIG